MAWLAVVLAVAAAQAEAPPPPGDTAPVDYARASAWICRPGAGAQGEADGTCAGDLDAVAVTAAGVPTRVPFAPPAATPPIDCFYVYPTTSDDPTFHSDLATDASERGTVHAQAARLSSVCRLFAPAYHQVTRAALRWRRHAPPGQVIADINAVPYRDIAAAWASYLAHDNHGRGVVLVGHSQGAILLKTLLRREIDGKPAQALLAGAYLAGNPDLGTASLPHVPVCAARGQVGCLVAWSSYPADYAGGRVFGGTREGAPVCVNPAALGGGRAVLKPVLARPAHAPTDVPADAPPFFAPVGQLTGECVADGAGAVLRVAVVPGPLAARMGAGLANMVTDPTWGLHPRDIQLVQGDLVDDIAAQGRTWAARER